MPVSSDFTDVLSELGVPAGALGLAVALVRGAKALEEDASKPALKYVSDLLKNSGVVGAGKIWLTLIPVIFERIFGSRPFSAKFFGRSIGATTLFWLILLAVRHPDWDHVWRNLTGGPVAGGLLVIALWYGIDWLSLFKAKWLIDGISRKHTLSAVLLFFLLDLFLSFSLPMIPALIAVALNDHGLTLSRIPHFLYEYFTLNPLRQYFSADSKQLGLGYVVIPSTLLTSVWTFLFFVSSIFVGLLAPIDHLRRFTVWWFRDIEEHPLTAIAKVMATLIIAGAALIKMIRWFAA